VPQPRPREGGGASRRSSTAAIAGHPSLPSRHASPHPVPSTSTPTPDRVGPGNRREGVKWGRGRRRGGGRRAQRPGGEVHRFIRQFSSKIVGLCGTPAQVPPAPSLPPVDRGSRMQRKGAAGKNSRNAIQRPGFKGLVQCRSRRFLILTSCLSWPPATTRVVSAECVRGCVVQPPLPPSGAGGGAAVASVLLRPRRPHRRPRLPHRPQRRRLPGRSPPDTSLHASSCPRCPCRLSSRQVPLVHWGHSLHCFGSLGAGGGRRGGGWRC